MLSKSLFKQSVKANWKLWTVVSFVMVILVAQFVAMESGVMDLTTTVYYGMMSFIIPTIYVVIVANNLVAHQVDDGSLAYVLSTSTKRKSVMFTQAMFFLGSMLVTEILITIVHVLLKALMGSDSISYLEIIKLNISNFSAIAAISGICFMFSSIFNRSKNTLGASGGISVFFIIMTMMAMFGGLSESMSALDNFKYLTIFTLFNKDSILSGGNIWILESLILFFISMCTYLAGSIYFCKKDLPL